MRTTIILAATLAVFTTQAEAATNYKKDYCNNQTYYTNDGADDGSTYPHLHCDKRWITYSKSGSKHYNFADGNGVQKGTANNACIQADNQDADQLKAVINTICDDDGEDCTDCQ